MATPAGSRKPIEATAPATRAECPRRYGDEVDGYLPGTGTILNTATVLAGGVLGMTIGHRLPERTKSVVTDCLGLVTLLMAALSACASYGSVRFPSVTCCPDCCSRRCSSR